MKLLVDKDKLIEVIKRYVDIKVKIAVMKADENWIDNKNLQSVYEFLDNNSEITLEEELKKLDEKEKEDNEED